MDYLLLQILLFLVLAAVIGFFIGWVTRGFGFESRLLVSENQWRSKHHALQNENSRLQSELDRTDLLESAEDHVAFALESTQTGENAIPRTEEIDSSSNNHPLNRLRNELNQIEEAHTNKIQQAQKQTEFFESQDNVEPAAHPPLDKDADDLTEIRGVGPKIQSSLNELGISQYKQMAELTEGNKKWLNHQLGFSGRVEREEWVEQARELVEQNSKPLT